MVPPRGRIPLTLSTVNLKDFSGQMSPSKPSGMPMTFHLCLRMAALVAARITALRPGASPPPVAMPIQRMSDMGNPSGVPTIIWVSGVENNVTSGRNKKGAPRVPRIQIRKRDFPPRKLSTHQDLREIAPLFVAKQKPRPRNGALGRL